VWVLRHAKAGPHGPDDHERPLTGKGRRQAAEVERFLADPPPSAAPRPELVLSSSATRAVETAQLVLPALGEQARFVVDRRLYGADPDDVVAILRELPDDVRSVMVVGHNPTLEEVALELVDPDDATGRERLERGLPTGALAMVRMPAPSWSVVSPGTGSLVELIIPGR
jgi:phosphohistidine phosphatase